MMDCFTANDKEAANQFDIFFPHLLGILWPVNLVMMQVDFIDDKCKSEILRCCLIF